MKADQLRRFASRVAAVVAEMNEAQRRMTQLRLAPDRYLFNASQGADCYAEFLARTAGPLKHEPSASERERRPRGLSR